MEHAREFKDLQIRRAMIRAERSSPRTYAVPEQPPLPASVAGNKASKIGPSVPRRIEHERAAMENAAMLIDTEDDQELLGLDGKYLDQYFYDAEYGEARVVTKIE